jgi:hypothetical protein
MRPNEATATPGRGWLDDGGGHIARAEQRQWVCVERWLWISGIILYLNLHDSLNDLLDFIFVLKFFR